METKRYRKIETKGSRKPSGLASPLEGVSPEERLSLGEKEWEVLQHTFALSSADAGKAEVYRLVQEYAISIRDGATPEDIAGKKLLLIDGWSRWQREAGPQVQRGFERFINSSLIDTGSKAGQRGKPFGRRKR